MQSARQKGFTLVEIAIVLVIIGLLIGGVLKGQEMITNARIKRIESDKAGIAAAMYSYQDRHQQLPGDDDSAGSRYDILNGQANINGDGDGVISGNWMAAAGTESSNFWKHLRAAELVPGSGLDATQPANAYGGNIGVRNGALLLSGHVAVFGAIEGPIAAIIEARLDDGNPQDGRIRSDPTAAILDGGFASTSTGYLDKMRYFMAFQL